TLFLPVQVSEPGRITRYQYDAEGRKTGETVTTR
ncbi:RHS repeat protein, partial [Pseudomonas aeruginosa]|nr:RHS repeat protein [Pseudomonas aeruginosa]MCO2159189.1 RHS repeat protein [Pseudomonas aeruginosa]MCT1208012.1 RHS repeat protein [Pseudomonas aeruginosa]MDO2911077.1 RHS repeat protein [Pseudomonas aeruginosa]MDP5733265.1 RHS repeat protein [Pseudomonas aeruginosa]